MTNDKLKTALFGYSKESVYEYIAELNNSFSEKTLQSETENELRVKKLEQKNRALQEENQKLKAKEDEIAQALYDAQQYAKQLKEEALKAQQEQIDRTAEKYFDARTRIDSVSTDITAFEKQLQDALERLKKDMEALNAKTNGLKASLNEAAEVDQSDEISAEEGSDAGETQAEDSGAKFTVVA